MRSRRIRSASAHRRPPRRRTDLQAPPDPAATPAARARCRAPGQFGTAAGEVRQHRGRDVVEVDEAGLRRQHTAPRRVHREAGVDVTARRRPRASPRANSSRRRSGRPAATAPATTRPASTSKPVADPGRRPVRRRARAAGSPRRRRAAAPARRRRRGLALGGVADPDAPLGLTGRSSQPALQVLPMRRRQPHQPLLLDVDRGQLRLGDHRRLASPGAASTDRTS